MQIINIYYKLILTLIGFLLFGFSFPLENTSGTELFQNNKNYRINIITAKSLKKTKKITEKFSKLINKPIYAVQQNNVWNVHNGGLQTTEEAQSDSSFDDIVSSDFKVDLRITEINSDIKIDGKLSEREWNSSYPSFSGNFYQQEPFDREPSTEKTEVRILFDKKNLYFGIRCYSNDPDKIFAKVMRRDGMLSNDDNIELFLDTYHDSRNCFYFSTNPIGAMVDAVVTDEGNFINRDWDAVWYCKTSRDNKVWCAEICIPFKSLQFKEGGESDWGINIGRKIAHKNESSFIVPIPRSLSSSGKYKASLFANLKNVKTASSSKNIQMIPYMSGGKIFEYNPNESISRFDRGFDIKYSITPNLVTDFTYKTDFAQVEADQEIINYTRFNINLPEKREFFLQSAGLFNFGSSSSISSLGRGPGYLLFNSRSIGVYDGDEVPILGGAKLTGKIGNYSLGFLNLHTEKTQIDDSYNEPSTNYTALNLKRDILKNSNIGMMFLNKQNSEGYYDRAVGIESYFSFKNEYSISGSIANNSKQDVNENNWAGSFKASIKKDWMDLLISYTQLDSLFKPDMGFIRRENIRSSYGWLGFTKWLNNQYFKSLSVKGITTYITDNHNVLETRRFGGDLRLTFATGDFISFDIDREYEFLPRECEIRNIILDPGIYNNTMQGISVRTYGSRPISGSISYQWSNIYSGKSNSISLNNSLNLSNNFNVDLSYSYTKLILKNGMAKSNLASGRFSYSFNPQLFVKYYIQWNDTNKKVVGNFLLKYIYKPKSHFYLVYNENRITDMPVFKSIRDRALLVKFTYLWNL